MWILWHTPFLCQRYTAAPRHLTVLLHLQSKFLNLWVVFQGARLLKPHLHIWSLTWYLLLQLFQGPKLGHFLVNSLLELFDFWISYLRDDIILFFIRVGDACNAHYVALIIECEFLFGRYVGIICLCRVYGLKLFLTHLLFFSRSRIRNCNAFLYFLLV